MKQLLIKARITLKTPESAGGLGALEAAPKSMVAG
jgi:hypothetical protein